MAEDDYVSL